MYIIYPYDFENIVLSLILTGEQTLVFSKVRLYKVRLYKVRLYM